MVCVNFSYSLLMYDLQIWPLISKLLRIARPMSISDIIYSHMILRSVVVLSNTIFYRISTISLCIRMAMEVCVYLCLYIYIWFFLDVMFDHERYLRFAEPLSNRVNHILRTCNDLLPRTRKEMEGGSYVFSPVGLTATTHFSQSELVG